MSTSVVRVREKNPIKAVLCDLQNLRTDMQFLLPDAGEAISRYYTDTLLFINAIEKSQTEENQNGAV